MKEQARDKVCKGKGWPLFFSSPTTEFLDQEQPHPKNLKKNHETSPEGDP